MDAKKLTEFQAQLQVLAAQITEAEQKSADERAPVELDQQMVGRLSRMDALQVQAMAKETSRRRTAELKRIEAALTRLKEGEFGYCLECGEEIAVRRLELDPAAPLCINCASGR
ncbi:MAG: TraR/DksA family transcriptional regulator [Paracoccaceae bacterium]|nr:TraR/DksA family transcriptional regulator [Paracoccaceae bacterium]